jgi:hypothetical protein
MMIAFFLACSVAIPLLINTAEEFDLFNGLSLFSPYIITFFLLSVLGFAAWLTSDDF